MGIEAKPILPRFGAEISGIDISRPLDEAARQQIVKLQNQWGVTVWRATGLSDETHIAFSSLFGYIERSPSAASDKPKRMKFPELFDASNLDVDGNIVDNEMVRLIHKGNRLWHTDSSFMHKRSAQSLLLCHEAPPDGGPTWFADTRSAYEDLPSEMKARIEGLEARHSYWWSRMKAGYPFTEAEIEAKPFARHRLVHVHEGSGRKALFVGAHAFDIVGLPKAEGRALLKELIDWCTQPQYVFSVHYKPGDMVIWDNLCTMHRGGDFFETAHRRDMRRTTIRDGEAPATPDDPFGEMFMAAGRLPHHAAQDAAP